jgi:large subunit ribosomal protein L13
MQKTAEVQRNWHLVDANDQVLGRLATQIAIKLIGKDKPTYTPHIDGGDYVVVINAKDVVLTRNKLEGKMYYHNTGFPGGHREVVAGKLLEEHPTRLIEKAVYNMLPKNKLRDVRMTRLKVYAGSEHTHQSQLGKTVKAE